MRDQISSGFLWAEFSMEKGEWTGAQDMADHSSGEERAAAP